MIKMCVKTRYVLLFCYDRGPSIGQVRKKPVQYTAEMRYWKKRRKDGSACSSTNYEKKTNKIVISPEQEQHAVTGKMNVRH